MVDFILGDNVLFLIVLVLFVGDALAFCTFDRSQLLYHICLATVVLLFSTGIHIVMNALLKVPIRMIAIQQRFASAFGFCLLIEGP